MGTCYRAIEQLMSDVSFDQFNDKYGRKHSITLGSIIIVIAAILQGTSVHGKLSIQITSE